VEHNKIKKIGKKTSLAQTKNNK